MITINKEYCYNSDNKNETNNINCKSCLYNLQCNDNIDIMNFTVKPMCVLL